MAGAAFFILLLLLSVYSYGFVDLHLTLSTSALYKTLQAPLSSLVFEHMTLAGIVYIVIVGSLYAIYLAVMRANESHIRRLLPLRLKTVFFSIAILLTFSFPAFTYDIFNYMTTAKVLYTHKENPYIVMPIEIPNEPALAYTRASNKVALYGPTWLAFTALPHVLGGGSVWRTIIAFKAMIAGFYLAMLYLIYRMTGSKRQVLFFGLNPLVLSEALVSSHNDIAMMVLALIGLALVFKKRMIGGILVWVASVFVKGATFVLLPILFLPHLKKITIYRIAYWLMFGIFLLTPLREELYPWYAVWFLTFAALIPMTKTSWVHGFTIALCIGLSLRHLPYILTREYGGYGPILRIAFTVIPVAVFGIYYFLRKAVHTKVKRTP